MLVACDFPEEEVGDPEVELTGLPALAFSTEDADAMNDVQLRAVYDAIDAITESLATIKTERFRLVEEPVSAKSAISLAGRSAPDELYVRLSRARCHF